MVKKTKSNTLKKAATLALANLLLIGALTDNSAKAESKKDDTDLKLVSHNVYMLSTVLYPNWGQYKRADLIGQSSYIKNNDVVIFNEAFDNGASDKLLSNVKKEYP
ncbi:phospholipase C [Staphylococcus aureus VET0318R]|nr:phospholipase C [Staphylococcus aureus VET0424R]KAA14946.1 phospholipase C [Staphylococcus aureus VET0063R]KAA69503.1 phospholipase C [Staphylococcus aureus VET0093R]KAC18968.1 phospholipase C [Staphylococcus aureus VET0214R]KAD78740.1 phospholipase C [Staphylococcus aureus VET0317R]KAD82859.1 phospholipase C [Staphylococcus aureus VET0318R]